jgi:hypothetical protein
MESKTCTSCNQTKPISNFYKDKIRNVYFSICNHCRWAKAKERYIPKVKEFTCDYCGKVFITNRTQTRRKSKFCSTQCQRKTSYIKNKETINNNSKRNYYKNLDKVTKRHFEWRKNNSKKIRDYFNHRMKTDPMFACKQKTRDLVMKAFKRQGWTKKSRTLEIIGCSYEQFRQHLESQFVEGMTMLNHGRWHIDHKIPLATAKTEADVIRLCHYTNLQPLWAIDNIRKGSKVLN